MSLSIYQYPFPPAKFTAADFWFPILELTCCPIVLCALGESILLPFRGGDSIEVD